MKKIYLTAAALAAISQAASASSRSELQRRDSFKALEDYRADSIPEDQRTYRKQGAEFRPNVNMDDIQQQGDSSKEMLRKLRTKKHQSPWDNLGDSAVFYKIEPNPEDQRTFRNQGYEFRPNVNMDDIQQQGDSSKEMLRELRTKKHQSPWDNLGDSAVALPKEINSADVWDVIYPEWTKAVMNEDGSYGNAEKIERETEKLVKKYGKETLEPIVLEMFQSFSKEYLKNNWPETVKYIRENYRKLLDQ